MQNIFSQKFEINGPITSEAIIACALSKLALGTIQSLGNFATKYLNKAVAINLDKILSYNTCNANKSNVDDKSESLCLGDSNFQNISES